MPEFKSKRAADVHAIALAVHTAAYAEAERLGVTDPTLVLYATAATLGGMVAASEVHGTPCLQRTLGLVARVAGSPSSHATVH